MPGIRDQHPAGFDKSAENFVSLLKSFIFAPLILKQLNILQAT